MSSDNHKPEPLFADSLIDESMATPNAYDPGLKFTVIDDGLSPIADKNQTFMYGAGLESGPKVVAVSEVADSTEDALIASSPTVLAPVSRAEQLMQEALVEAKFPQAEGELPFQEKAKRTTVLPKAKLKGEVPTLHMIPRDRYEELKDLGEGAAGDVLLARDNDIQRLVALKRLKKKHHAPAALARFVEEIQTVGQLEHPNIVPIHDVGVDENGQYYFVMKYMEGQTMADVIKRLKEGDKETHAQFTHTVRNQIFLKTMQALQFAHKQGIIHRDIKPENIMVGNCGEVMVMDWGIAKRLPAPYNGQTPGASLLDGERSAREGVIEEVAREEANPPLPEGTLETRDNPLLERERLFETRVGTMMGTPAYMPPEQALGRIDQIDERSDIYSLGALYYEWMSLEHYLGHKTNIKELLWGILEEVPAFPSSHSSPHQNNLAAEYSYFVAKALKKEPKERFQSISEMIYGFQLAMEGKFGVHCPITLIKRSGNETLRLVDRFPLLAMGGAFLAIVLTLLGTFQVGYWIYLLTVA